MCTKGNMHLSACGLQASSCTDISGKSSSDQLAVEYFSIRASLRLFLPTDIPYYSELQCYVVIATLLFLQGCGYKVRESVTILQNVMIKPKGIRMSQSHRNIILVLL